MGSCCLQQIRILYEHDFILPEWGIFTKYLVVLLILLGSIGTSYAQYMGNIGNLQEYSSPIIKLHEFPLKQFKSGIGSQDVLCKDGLFLVLKHDKTSTAIFDNKPACVKPETLLKLAERHVIELSSFYNSRPLIERLYAGMAIMRSSELLIMYVSTDYEQHLSIQITDDELSKMLNAQEYYEKAIRERIPFDVPIIVYFGKFWGFANEN